MISEELKLIVDKFNEQGKMNFLEETTEEIMDNTTPPDGETQPENSVTYSDDDLYYLAAAVCREAGGEPEEILYLDRIGRLCPCSGVDISSGVLDCQKPTEYKKTHTLCDLCGFDIRIQKSNRRVYQ